MAKPSPGEFVRQVRQETSKVIWPSRKEAVTTSIMVLIMVTIMSIFFVGVDQLLAIGIEWLLGLGV